MNNPSHRHDSSVSEGFFKGLRRKASAEFQKRNQDRFAAELSLECARELAANKEWQQVVELLRPLWKDVSFRAAGWQNICEELAWTLRTAAAMTMEADLVVAIDWALLNRSEQKSPNPVFDP